MKWLFVTVLLAAVAGILAIGAMLTLVFGQEFAVWSFVTAVVLSVAVLGISLGIACPRRSES